MAAPNSMSMSGPPPSATPAPEPSPFRAGAPLNNSAFGGQETLAGYTTSWSDTPTYGTPVASGGEWDEAPAPQKDVVWDDYLV